MSTNTPNYNLVKPQDTDNADLKIFVGNNMDLIDTALLNKIDNTVKASATQLGLIKVGSGLSIDVNGVLTASGGGGGLPTTGGNLTGPLTISGNRVQALDANGSYTNGTNSAFLARTSAVQSLGAGVVTKANFGAKTLDVLSEFDTSLGRFTAKASGVYLFSACLRFPAPASGTITGLQAFLAFYKNGSAESRVQQLVNGAITYTGTTSTQILAPFQVHGCVIMSLNAGDYVEVYTFAQFAASTQTTSIQGFETNGYDTAFFRGIKLA
jgi:hypothetical protein